MLDLANMDTDDLYWVTPKSTIPNMENNPNQWGVFEW